MFKRNGFSMLSVALVDFHDAMETILTAASAKDVAGVTSLYPSVSEKLKPSRMKTTTQRYRTFARRSTMCLPLRNPATAMRFRQGRHAEEQFHQGLPQARIIAPLPNCSKGNKSPVCALKSHITCGGNRIWQTREGRLAERMTPFLFPRHPSTNIQFDPYLPSTCRSPREDFPITIVCTLMQVKPSVSQR